MIPHRKPCSRHEDAAATEEEEEAEREEGLVSAKEPIIIIHASSQMHMHDIVFHVIFGSDLDSIFQMVQASAIRLYTVTSCPFLASMMRALVAEASPANADANAVMARDARKRMMGPDLIKALFFLFLNVDMPLKEYICKPRCERAFAAAMNMQRVSDARKRMVSREHAWSMMGTKPMDPAKGRRFFTVLHDSIVKLWMQDERLHASDLVQMVKEEYLVS